MRTTCARVSKTGAGCPASRIAISPVNGAVLFARRAVGVNPTQAIFLSISKQSRHIWSGWQAARKPRAGSFGLVFVRWVLTISPSSSLGQSESMQAMFTGRFGGGVSPSKSESTGRISSLSWKNSL